MPTGSATATRPDPWDEPRRELVERFRVTGRPVIGIHPAGGPAAFCLGAVDGQTTLPPAVRREIEQAVLAAATC